MKRRIQLKVIAQKSPKARFTGDFDATLSQRLIVRQ